MELARLRSALGEGHLVEVEIDKLRALLGAVEADVRLLRQVKDEEGGLQDCTDGEFILRSPEHRKKMLSQAVKTAGSTPQAQKTLKSPSFFAKSPPGAPPKVVPQGLRSVQSAAELRKAPPELRPLTKGAPRLGGSSASTSHLPGLEAASFEYTSERRGVRATRKQSLEPLPLQGAGHRLDHLPGSSPAASLATSPSTSSRSKKVTGTRSHGTSDASPETWHPLGGSPAASPSSSDGMSSRSKKITGLAVSPDASKRRGDAGGSGTACPASASSSFERRPLCQHCGQPLPEHFTRPCVSQQSRLGSSSSERAAIRTTQNLEVAHLLTRLEAAGIGPWQIAELKASEAKLAELAKPSGRG